MYQVKLHFFMLVTVIKHGGQWDVLDRVFKMKTPTCERLVTRFVALQSLNLFEGLVTDNGKNYSMGDHKENGQTFTKYLHAPYATDVTFQQSFRPSGSVEEGYNLYCGKNKLYGYKMETRVLTNGLCIGASRHYAGVVSDLET